MKKDRLEEIDVKRDQKMYNQNKHQIETSECGMFAFNKFMFFYTIESNV